MSKELILLVFLLCCCLRASIPASAYCLSLLCGLLYCLWFPDWYLLVKALLHSLGNFFSLFLSFHIQNSNIDQHQLFMSSVTVSKQLMMGENTHTTLLVWNSWPWSSSGFQHLPHQCLLVNHSSHSLLSKINQQHSPHPPPPTHT